MDSLDGETGTRPLAPPPEDSRPDANLDKQLARARAMAGLFNAEVEPTRIGRFALIKRIGAGGMGEVYAAYDDQLDRKIAIKLVRPGVDDVAGLRLRREAQILARLSHPNVVQVYDAGEVGDRVFVAMEFIRGRSLRQWLGTTRPVVSPTVQGRGTAPRPGAPASARAPDRRGRPAATP
jgi:hypothetical protein